MTMVAGLPRQEFRAGRWRWLGPVALGLVLVAVGAFWWGRDANAVPRSLAYAALGSGAVLVLWFGGPWWRRAPLLWFDARGLSAAVPGPWPLPWRDIASVRLVRRGGRAWLAVDRAAAARAAVPLARLPQQLARSAGVDDVAVPLSGLVLPAERVAQVVALALEHERLRVAAGEPG